MAASHPEELRQVDFGFVVDTTGSMGPFIAAAKEQMASMLQALASDDRVDLHVGIVEYRDHPPQDSTFASRAHAFTADLGAARRTIAGLKADGGGDNPETVFDGLRAACEDLGWRPRSRRLAVLVGDAPPHDPCACGLVRDAVTALVERRGVLLHAIGLTTAVEASFAPLANATGGDYFTASAGPAAIASLRELLNGEFAHLAFDGHVLAARVEHGDWNLETLARTLGAPRGRVSSSLSRLGRRGFLPG